MKTHCAIQIVVRTILIITGIAFLLGAFTAADSMKKYAEKRRWQ